MFEKMTDGEVMVYLRNEALQMSRIAQERGITIDVRCEKDGYVYATAGDYEIFQRAKESSIRYDYHPLGTLVHEYDIQPQQIRFLQKPAELVEADYGQ